MAFQAQFLNLKPYTRYIYSAMVVIGGKEGRMSETQSAQTLQGGNVMFYIRLVLLSLEKGCSAPRQSMGTSIFKKRSTELSNHILYMISEGIGKLLNPS